MAWNGSGSAPSDVKTSKSSVRTSDTRFKIQSGIVGLIVISAIIVAAILFWNEGPEKLPVETKPSRQHIVSVLPSIPANRTVEGETAPKPVDPKARPTKVGEHVNGYVKLASGRIHKIRGEITNDMSSVKADYEIFDHYCDNEIACLLSLKPGDTLVGDPPYRGRLTKDFMESLKHPIIIDENDSEHDKELKRAVRETKIELKAAMDRGEDLEQIMLDSRAECRRLAEYKRLIQQEVRKQKHNEQMTDEDFSDYVSAANQLLESKGIAPLNATPLMRRKMMLDSKLDETEME